MRFFFLIILLIVVNSSHANEFVEIDKTIASSISFWLDTNNTDQSGSQESCHSTSISLKSLKSCHRYIEGVYITDDIDSYMAYVNQLLYFGVKVQNFPVFNKVIDAQYEEITSKLYFNIAYSAYENQRYEEALNYLKKIDDSLDDDSVYHALLIYGLIYFEQEDYEKSKFYLKRIDKSSKYYSSSQYNLGLISMKAYWWSEAEEHLNKAISTFDIKDVSEYQSYVMDKLYLTLGYSQISRKNFRSSKASFSNVSLKSPIKMRALMGIALSEIGLGRLGKAATILKIIKNKSQSSVKFDALVTLPQVYQRAGNIKETVEYYKTAISEMSVISDVIKHRDKTLVSKMQLLGEGDEWKTSNIVVRKAIIDDLLKYRLVNRKFGPLLKSSLSQLEKIKDKYTVSRSTYLSELLNNYIKQSKYALAVIYDQSVVMK